VGECGGAIARPRLAGREPVQAGNPVPVSTGSPGGSTTVRKPLPFHYTDRVFLCFLVRRPADPGS
jgi:hypothetical protein